MCGIQKIHPHTQPTARGETTPLHHSIARTLGVTPDDGGTSCRARITDLEGTTLGEGYAGSANPRVGLDAACNAILQATSEAMTNAGLEENDFTRIYAGLGLAGVNQKKERNLVLEWGFPFAGIFLETDAYAACMGAFNGRDGAILILGTGSLAQA